MSTETKSKNKQKKDQAKGATAIDEKRFPKKIKHRRQMPKGPHGGMQLMLIEHVPNLGTQGDIVEVKPGYGRNYLLPQGLATFVTPDAMIRIQKHKASQEALRIAQLNDLKMVAKKLEKASVSIEAKANEDGHLYGSVTAVEIAEALKKEDFLTIEASNIQLDGHLKELGLYNVSVSLDSEIEPVELKVWVVPSSDKN